jgi:maltose 6'-phosphate phosphatase
LKPAIDECRSAGNVAASGAVLRVVSYNVEFGRRGTPRQIGEALRPQRPDVLLLNEAPAGAWCPELGRVLGLEHSFVGTISSANHKDKYKSIVSRTPLENPSDILVRGYDWNPASVVRAETVSAGNRIALFALHLSGGYGEMPESHTRDFFGRVLAGEKVPLVFAGGDFNDRAEAPVMRRGEALGFRVTWADLGLSLQSEFTCDAVTGRSEGVIDHIVYRVGAGATATDGGILKFQPPLSDHHPIWAEMRFPAAARPGALTER